MPTIAPTTRRSRLTSARTVTTCSSSPNRARLSRAAGLLLDALRGLDFVPKL